MGFTQTDKLIDLDNPIAESIHVPGADNLGELLEFLSHIDEDPDTPRSVKNAIKDIRGMLTDESEPDMNLRKSHALARVEEIVEDPNIPSHGRTVLWDVLGRIESL